MTITALAGGRADCPDRIMIGVVRCVDAFDVLQAMNTGYDCGMPPELVAAGRALGS